MMSDEEFDVVLSRPNDWDAVDGAWKSKQLRVPGLRVTKVFANGEDVPQHLFELSKGLLQWSGPDATEIAVHYTIEDDEVSALISERKTLQTENESLDQQRLQLEKSKARWKAAAIVLTAIPPIVTLGLRLYNPGDPKQPPVAVAPCPVPAPPPPGPYDDLLKAAGDKPYALPQISMIVDLERGRGLERRAHTRFVYEVLAKSDIQLNSRAFGEWYDASSSTSAYRTPGSESELDVADSNTKDIKWDVRFALRTGQMRTIVTGADAVYSKPPPAGRRVHFFRSLPSDVDVFCYPNDDRDAIGGILIMVQSHSFSFREAQAGIGPDVADPMPVDVAEPPSNGGANVLIARFPGPLPTQAACLKFRLASH